MDRFLLYTAGLSFTILIFARNLQSNGMESAGRYAFVTAMCVTFLSYAIYLLVLGIRDGQIRKKIPLDQQQKKFAQGTAARIWGGVYIGCGIGFLLMIIYVIAHADSDTFSFRRNVCRVEKTDASISQSGEE